MRATGRVVVMLALGAGTGCASFANPLPSGGSGSGAGAHQERVSDTDARTEAALAATLMPTGPERGESLTLQLGRAAYTAAFRLVPGQGAMMIYPRPGFGAPDGFLFPGIHRLVPAAYGTSFVSSLNGMLPGSRLFPTATDSDFGPEYYFVVASERPLRLDGTLFGGSWHHPSADGYPTMQWLVSQTIPERAAANWTTDFFVHWPETIGAAGQQGFVPLNCNGSRVWVDPNQYDRAMRALCGDSGLPPGAGTAEEDPTDVGGTNVVVPQRRPPAADGLRVSSRQLDDPYGWETARRDAAGTGSRGGRIAPPASVAPPEAASTPAQPARRSPGSSVTAPDDDASTPGDAVGRTRPTPAMASPSTAGGSSIEAGRRRPEGDLPIQQRGDGTDPDDLRSGPQGGSVSRARPGLDIPAEDLTAAPSTFPVDPGADVLQPGLRPIYPDPMMPTPADAGRIRPGYHFPVGQPSPDPWTMPDEPAAVGMPAPVLGVPNPPSRRQPLPVEPPPEAAPAPPSGGDGTGGDVPRTRPAL